MDLQVFIKITKDYDCEVVEYEDHYCIHRKLVFEGSASCSVTIPKVKQLLDKLVEKAKKVLGIG